jgi:GNAT superfamily N-acetyltransferase
VTAEYRLTPAPAGQKLVRVTLPDGLHVRRVGFRDGTDAELTALHAVETPIAAERGSIRMPEPLDAYMAYARNLPSQFSDHAWLAETAEGTPVACGFCWSNSAGDDRVMECDVLVRADHRRQGIGSWLLSAICAESEAEGRSLLTWSTYGTAPAGDAFSRRVGARVARLNRKSQLVLADADWAMIGDWARADRARALGYRLELVDGAYPESVRPDAVAFHHIMESAPRDDLDFGDWVVDEQFIAERDRALVEAGGVRWTLFARDQAGTLAGGTEVTFEPSDPATALQQDTATDPAHRGLGLAKWAKASMLQLIRDRRPEVVRIRTENAGSNAPMLGINNALGFAETGTRTEWQADNSDLLNALG